MKNYSEINEHINTIISKIGNYASEDEIFNLKAIQKNFNVKVEDFHREGRKLNIGVIGRVKAGKSSFLNTLLFNGEEVLPKAATPKTATLTKMEYSEQNRIVIEYYSVDEWEGIKEDAKLGDKNEITKSAKELVDMARKNGIDVESILSQGKLDKSFDEYSELIDFLNEYVGENGKYTPLVRSVVIYMNREDFKDISIVDTPGLNDPIPSRTQRTKEFIEVCDVVFFLSRAGSFLDNNDWELLCKQLPQKGVKKMVLVASQYDSGLRDVLIKEQKKTSSIFGEEPAWRKKAKESSHATNLPDAKIIVRNSLTSRVKENIESFEKTHEYDDFESILKMLKECETPILVSSRAQDMSNKDYSEYNAEEKNDLQYWESYIPADIMKEEFRSIGNFDEVTEIYLGLREEKQRLLEEKERQFIPTVYLELKSAIAAIKNRIETKVEYLQANDKDSLAKQQLAFESKILAIEADIAEVFGNTIIKIKEEKGNVNKELREMSIEAAKLEVHTGTETHSGTHTTHRISIGPIKLGRKSSSYSYTTTYKYLAASDALEQINVYGKSAANEIESLFQKIVELKAYRRKLLDTVIRNFDTSDESFDSNYFRLVIQNAINKIEFPEVHIDVSKELDEVGSKFSGEVRKTSEQEEFRKLLSVTVKKLYDAIVNKVYETIEDFRSAMEDIREVLSNEILKNVSDEFESIKEAIASKEQEVNNGKQYISILEDIIKEL